jgi:hypothetical protein
MEKHVYQFKVGNLHYWTLSTQLSFALDNIVYIPYIHFHGSVGSYYVLHINPDIPGVPFCGLSDALTALLSLEN